MKELNLNIAASILIVGLMTWNVATTQQLTVQMARFEADALNRIARLEYWTERLANRVNALETNEDVQK